MRIKSKVVGVIMLAMISAASLALNAFNFKPDIPWSWIAFISFVAFAAIVAWGWYGAETRARQAEWSRPSVVFHGLSPVTTVTSPTGRLGYFVRLDFINNCAYPSGEVSTAHALTASIEVFDKGDLVDGWDGRWANTDAPRTSGDIWLLNRLELPANNQRATLDIGFRFEGEQVFTGWDNAHYLGVTPSRIPIKPDSYKLQVTLAASNMDERVFEFYLTIPDEPQSKTSWPQIRLR